MEAASSVETGSDPREAGDERGVLATHLPIWDALAQDCTKPSETTSRLTVKVLIAGAVAVAAVTGVAFAMTQGVPTESEFRLFVLAIASVMLLVLYGWLNARYPTKYRPALWALAPLAPLVAIVAALGLAVYYAENGLAQPVALAAGGVIGLGVWILLAASVREVSRADVANGRAYQQIQLRLRQLAERIQDMELAEPSAFAPHRGAIVDGRTPMNGNGTNAGGGPPASTSAASASEPSAREANGVALSADFTDASEELEHRTALDEAKAQLQWVLCDTTYAPHGPDAEVRSGFRWSTASGYVNCFRALHRAEEALTDVEPLGLLLGDGLHNYFSLRDSRVPNRDALMTTVRRAIGRLYPADAHDFFESGDRSVGPSDRRRQAAASDESSSVATEERRTGTEAPRRRGDERSARAVLREVRFAINDFRDDAFDGIVRQRNRLWRTILATGLVTYFILSLAILAHAPTQQLLIASAYFMTGAVVGMFNQLRVAGSARSAIEDFGLSEALLVQIPLVSGLSALAGVVITGIVSPAALAGVGKTVTVPTLGEIFGPETFAGYLLVAAFFGLSPALLVERLRKETRDLQNDIISSEPTRKDQRAADFD
jgi:hypothetical protein